MESRFEDDFIDELEEALTANNGRLDKKKFRKLLEKCKNQPDLILKLWDYIERNYERIHPDDREELMKMMLPILFKFPDLIIKILSRPDSPASKYLRSIIIKTAISEARLDILSMPQISVHLPRHPHQANLKSEVFSAFQTLKENKADEKAITGFITRNQKEVLGLISAFETSLKSGSSLKEPEPNTKDQYRLIIDCLKHSPPAVQEKFIANCQQAPAWLLKDLSTQQVPLLLNIIAKVPTQTLEKIPWAEFIKKDSVIHKALLDRMPNFDKVLSPNISNKISIKESALESKSPQPSNSSYMDQIKSFKSQLSASNIIYHISQAIIELKKPNPGTPRQSHSAALFQAASSNKPSSSPYQALAERYSQSPLIQQILVYAALSDPKFAAKPALLKIFSVGTEGLDKVLASLKTNISIEMKLQPQDWGQVQENIVKIMQLASAENKKPEANQDKSRILSGLYEKIDNNLTKIKGKEEIVQESLGGKRDYSTLMEPLIKSGKK